ncbi:MAG: glycine cleavage system protein GcvH [candidate division WOR-3 bacterium]|nr:MAG: glycine cleavage system protein GcvH [candidate division WOR-3 bacterium]
MANIPKDLKYTKTHEWVRVEGENVTTGVTDFAQSELSDIVYVDINTVGSTVSRNEPIGTIEAVKAVADMNAPVSGEVLEANTALQTEPAKVNQDPYGEGWIARLKLTKQEELDDLLDPAGYADLVKKSEHH